MRQKVLVVWWSQRSSDLVKTICKRQSASPGQRGWPHASPSPLCGGQDEVLCPCEGLEMGIGDIPPIPIGSVWDTVCRHQGFR